MSFCFLSASSWNTVVCKWLQHQCTLVFKAHCQADGAAIKQPPATCSLPRIAAECQWLRTDLLPLIPRRTPRLARRAGARVIKSARLGRAAQMNAGAAAARGELLAFVHADSRPPTGLVDVIRGAFRDPKVLVAGFKVSIEGVWGSFWEWENGWIIYNRKIFSTVNAAVVLINQYCTEQPTCARHSS